MNYSNLNKLSKEEILSGSFGIERETLRVKNNQLALTPHPEIFGDKIKNPIVTTDFSESQIEIVSPTFDDIDDAFSTFCLLSDIVNDALPKDEYFWFNSIPCILPEDDRIPIARYGDDKEGQESQKYRMNLAEKYGLKKQMLSGIHFNFSFADATLEKLYSFENEEITFKEFKNNLYLKIARNYLRYCWLVIYLTGCSIAAHESFSEDCIELMNMKDIYGSYYSTEGVSFRNASCGYKNLVKLYPSYDSVENFKRDVLSYIESGKLSQAKELYTQIRLKPKDPKDLLNSLADDGIEYVEVRTLDINPFFRCGITKRDMQFLHLLLIYAYVKNESDYADWQKEAFFNEELCASKAFDSEMRLLKDGCEISLKEWGLEIINEMLEMVDDLEINYHDTLNAMKSRIEHPELTYARQLRYLIEKEGYVTALTKLSIKNKVEMRDSKKKEKYRRLALKPQA